MPFWHDLLSFLFDFLIKNRKEGDMMSPRCKSKVGFELNDISCCFCNFIFLSVDDNKVLLHL